MPSKGVIVKNNESRINIYFILVLETIFVVLIVSGISFHVFRNLQSKGVEKEKENENKSKGKEVITRKEEISYEKGNYLPHLKQIEKFSVISKSNKWGKDRKLILQKLDENFVIPEKFDEILSQEAKMMSYFLCTILGLELDVKTPLSKKETITEKLNKLCNLLEKFLNETEDQKECWEEIEKFPAYLEKVFPLVSESYENPEPAIHYSLFLYIETKYPAAWTKIRLNIQDLLHLIIKITDLGIKLPQEKLVITMVFYKIRSRVFLFLRFLGLIEEIDEKEKLANENEKSFAKIETKKKVKNWKVNYNNKKPQE